VFWWTLVAIHRVADEGAAARRAESQGQSKEQLAVPVKMDKMDKLKSKLFESKKTGRINLR
jgi:hypothetical protein